jgi:hypothetical protein
MLVFCSKMLIVMRDTSIAALQEMISHAKVKRKKEESASVFRKRF